MSSSLETLASSGSVSLPLNLLPLGAMLVTVRVIFGRGSELVVVVMKVEKMMEMVVTVE